MELKLQIPRFKKLQIPTFFLLKNNHGILSDYNTTCPLKLVNDFYITPLIALIIHGLPSCLEYDSSIVMGLYPVYGMISAK